MGPKNDVFWGGEKGVNVRFWFYYPEKAYHCTELHLLTYFVKIHASVLAVGDLKNNPPPKIAESILVSRGRETAHAEKRNPLSDLDNILQGGRYPQRNHLCKYNTLTLPCERVIIIITSRLVFTA